MKTAQKTDIGRIRTVNEDRFVVMTDLPGFTLAIVADGMGGHQAGDTASQMAVDIIGAELREAVISELSPEKSKQAVIEAVGTANRHVFELASNRENYHGMGTTVVVTLATESSLIIGHIGDSRAYLVHGGELTQLTADHSLVNELVRNGQITEEEANTHPRRNVLTRALGTEPTIDTEINEYAWKEGDIALICTDGLSGLLDNRSLLEILHSEADLETKVQQLMEKALDAGGDDNITAVLLENVGLNPTGRGDGE
jgi:serine/threonine protein phosphatase PrpC